MKQNLKQLMVALGFALVAAISAGSIYRQRDVYFEWSWAQPHGRLDLEVPAALADSARNEAEKAEPGKACVARGLARDRAYVYVGLGCAAHATDPARAEGDVGLRAARFRYWGDHAYGLERADRSAYENSVRRLFPREVYQRLKLVARSEYLAALVSRASK